MYNTSIQTILAVSVLFVIFTWIGSVKASRLLYSGSLEKLHRKTRKLLFWAWFPIIPAAAIVGAIVWLQMNMEPIFWKDRVFLQAPLVVVPLLSIWFVAVPKLLKLRSLTKQCLAEGGAAIEPAMFLWGHWGARPTRHGRYGRHGICSQPNGPERGDARSSFYTCRTEKNSHTQLRQNSGCLDL